MRALAVVSALVFGFATAAQAAPSPEALSIALAAIPPDNERSVDKLAGDLTIQILAADERNRTHPGCDQHQRACEDAAAKIAQEAVPAIAEGRRTDTARLLATAIDVLLTPSERQAAARFYASSAGSKMALATFGLSDFRRFPPEVQSALYAELERESGDRTPAPSLPALTERFRQATLELPRAVEHKAGSEQRK